MIAALLTIQLIINPATTVCYSRPLHGWHRITYPQRNRISKQVGQHKRKMIEAQTLECIDYSQKPLKQFVLHEQFWRWK